MYSCIAPSFAITSAGASVPSLAAGYYFWQDNVGGASRGREVPGVPPTARTCTAAPHPAGPTDNLNCPLWLAAYDSNPLIPAAWGAWSSDDGRGGDQGAAAHLSPPLPCRLLDVLAGESGGRKAGLRLFSLPAPTPAHPLPSRTYHPTAVQRQRWVGGGMWVAGRPVLLPVPMSQCTLQGDSNVPSCPCCACAGNIPGISGNVDVDQFAGDSGNLANLCF